MRFCLLDDSSMVAEALALTLGDLGHSVAAARTGAESRALIADAGPFDALVADINLRGENGADIAAELRAAHAGLTVIVTSGQYSAEATRKYGPGCGGDAFLPKPFTARQLLAAVDAARRARAR